MTHDEGGCMVEGGMQQRQCVVRGGLRRGKQEGSYICVREEWSEKEKEKEKGAPKECFDTERGAEVGGEGSDKRVMWHFFGKFPWLTL